MNDFIIQSQNSQFKSIRGLRLFYRKWEHPERKPLRIASIVHGLGEHSGRYGELASFLTDYNFLVFSYDLYGFGRSEGKRGDVRLIDDWIRDQKILYNLALTKRDYEKCERLLIGQSMGGLLALAYLEKYPQDFTHAIILSPALRPEKNVSSFILFLSRIMKVICPAIAFNNTISVDELTDNDKDKDEYLEDSLVHNKITPRLFFQMVKLSRNVLANRESISNNLSILFIHGEDDTVTIPDDTHSFYTSLPVEDKSLLIIPGMKHETLHHTQKEVVYQHLSRWIEARFC